MNDHIITLAERQMTFAKNVGTFILYIFSKNYTCSLGEAYRTEEQAKLYADSGQGIQNSLHCKRLALDFNLFSDGMYLSDSKAYEKFGAYWKELHPDNNWGGDFVHRVDGNHISMSDGITEEK